MIGAAHTQAFVTLVERKSGYAVLAKLKNKTAVLVGRTIEVNPKPLRLRVKTLTVDSCKEFADHQAIDQTLGIASYFADPFAAGSEVGTRTLTGYCANKYPRLGEWKLSPMRS